ncbi:hypothetical protein [Halotalea alkalilenta]|uniref:Lipoprotein n=1 Tax=Halotalea alkalilenta TaxID=376489 RepID=A0A172YD42_9GAMM|nr:hypothetical protein [Halotalea alkalilenta]ANF57170.1 hypothetical protein A5892_06580 [Halotalea alkalilenta]
MPSVDLRRLLGPIVLLTAIALSACSSKTADPYPAVPQPSAADTQAWVGRWNGPEGTFLELFPSGEPDQMRMTLKDNLDSQADYRVEIQGQTLRFLRHGVLETIRPGSGAETGFKWLADKQDCLIVVPEEEGYCRD